MSYRRLFPALAQSSTSRRRRSTNASSEWSARISRLSASNSSGLLIAWQSISIRVEALILMRPQRARPIVVGLAKLLEATRLSPH